MPIKNAAIYPGHWKQFSEYIRFERAAGVCECTGECGRDHRGRCTAINGVYGKIGRDGVWRSTDSIHALQSDAGMALYPNFNFIGARVVLTVAHLDSDGGICTCKKDTGFKCANPAHNKAMCQGCHLLMDLPHHMKNAAQTRMEKKDAGRGLLTIFGNSQN